MSRSRSKPPAFLKPPILGEKVTTRMGAAPQAKHLLDEIERLRTKLSEQAQQILLERETQLKEIARELHDNFGQYLTIMDMELGTLADVPELSPSSRARALKLRESTITASHALGRVAGGLRPMPLEGEDIETAALRLLEEWSERCAVAFDMFVSTKEYPVPPLVGNVLYRVLQEAITNVAKHAQATRVDVVVRSLSREVAMIVEDDGIGFDWSVSKLENGVRGLGLLGVRERLALVGGTVEIESTPGSGTTLLMRVPL